MAEDPSEQATGNKTATTPSAPLLPQRGSTAVSDRPGARPGGPGPTHSDGDAKARMLMTAQLVYFLTPLRVRGPALTPVPACIPSWRPHTQQTAYPLSNGRPGSESQPRRAYQKRAFRGHRRVPNATPYPTPLQDTEMVSLPFPASLTNTSLRPSTSQQGLSEATEPMVPVKTRDPSAGLALF